MEQTIRNRLRSVVTQCRKLLEDAVAQTLQGQFGIYSGNKGEVHVEDAARMTHLSEEDQAYRKDILDHLEHIKARGYKPKEVLEQLIREIAFTHLNRLCAYKLMEARQVWIGGRRFREAVSRGQKSQGFMFYLADHPEDEARFRTGQQDVAYRHFLDWLGDTLSEEIGVLFDPHDPANRLYPAQRVLDEVLALINSEELAGIWAEDETIGWVYQYFTPKELRDTARKESPAPRNTYELAFRNQFFTPRYVVEFLTDNTVGRIWYEMRKGDTKLKDQCRYMLRQTTDLFLKEGESTPTEVNENGDDLTQEALLKRSVCIPYRLKKDPRDLKILDPACGSGHFLLYCFDLLWTIYEEAYHDPNLSLSLQKEYPTLDDLRRAIPGLILSCNLHGIDIDMRATQIAALALWLRCQRAYQEIGLTRDRPKIIRSNIVCAEPMPGEREMLKEFLDELQPRVLGQLVEVIFEKMQLAGEAGSLLKIEDEIRQTIAIAKNQWLAEIERATDRKDNQLLFSRAEMERLSKVATQRELFDVSGITEEDFWNNAEAIVLDSLLSYVQRANAGTFLQRQLFADDSARGFGFIDLCRGHFDIVLMNPPFGMCSKPSKDYIEQAFPRTRKDLYAAFVERGLAVLTPRGMLGAISSRTGFFLTSFQKWREEILLKEASPTVFADLGSGVLDTAMVETAAYCLEATPSVRRSIFIRLLQQEDKASSMSVAIDKLRVGQSSEDIFVVETRALEQVPGSPFAYWVSERIRKIFVNFSPFETTYRRACITNPAGDDQRYFRCYWEVNPSSVGRQIRWVPIARGGRFNPFHTDVQQVVDWDDAEQTYRGFQGTLHRPLKKPASLEYFFKPGLTWPLRGIRFSAQALPTGCIFSVAGKFATSDKAEELPILLGLMNSQIFDSLIGFFAGKVGGVQYEVGLINKIPVPNLFNLNGKYLGKLALSCATIKRNLEQAVEPSHTFDMPAILKVLGDTLTLRSDAWQTQAISARRNLAQYQREIDKIAFELYGLDESDRRSVDDSLRRYPTAEDVDDERGTTEDDNYHPEVETNTCTLVGDLLSYNVGAVFGRWDIRYAIGEKHSPELPELFEALPVCSPGMLQGDDGLPLSETPKGYLLRINWDGILVDDPSHQDDIIRRVRDVLEVIWKDKAEPIEKEACGTLSVKELRDYFRKPGKGGFWDDHVSRYSKSHRKAPIYWLLQSSKKNYGLWLYYHRFDKDVLFKALLNHIEPKIRLEESHLEALRAQRIAAGALSKGGKKFDKEIERQEEFVSELRDFEDKLRRAANLHLEPDINDGVVLNIAPLWELVPWKEAKNYWEELLSGKYEWASIGKQLRQRGLVHSL